MKGIHDMLKEPHGLPKLVQGLYKVFWIAVEELIKELKVRDYPPIMENQMEKKWKMKWKLGEYRHLRNLN